jgi:hypothetical protein
MATCRDPKLKSLVGETGAEIVPIKIVSVPGANKQVAGEVIASNRPERAMNKSRPKKEWTGVVHRAEKESAILQCIVPISGNQHKTARCEDPA